MSFLNVPDERKRVFYREYFKRERAAGRVPRSFKRWLDQIEAGEFILKNGLNREPQILPTWEGK